ncbi:hypothetical protein MKZ38_001732 [Zalerion maritima]|uniref:Ubiquitin-like protease family profile domain-containing protein n=1 Tax=Zalerion maritima TaxID=339359 RepID=A0AAD5RPS3_9PEZI|nr:hypothetical protein MKZ38_001732 [Zalerion maritima]
MLTLSSLWKDETSLTTPETVPCDQNIPRKHSKDCRDPSWSAFRRYTDALTSTGPDFRYSLPTRDPSVKPGGAEAVMPRNSLSSNPRPPPSKKPKIGPSPNYTNSGFVLDTAVSDIQQSSNGSTSFVSAGVSEYRMGQPVPQRTARQRHRIPKARLKIAKPPENRDDPIHDDQPQVISDGEDPISSTPRVVRSSTRRNEMQAPRQPQERRAGRQGTKRPSDSEPDELQNDEPPGFSKYRPHKKRQTNFSTSHVRAKPIRSALYEVEGDSIVDFSPPRKRITNKNGDQRRRVREMSTSPMRGDIKITSFPKRKRSADADSIDKFVKLELVAAVATQHHWTSEAGFKIFLRQDKNNGRLFPYHEDGTDISSKFSWMIVDLPSCGKIDYCEKEGTFVRIGGANTVERGTLILQFSTGNACEDFLVLMRYFTAGPQCKVNPGLPSNYLARCFENTRKKYLDWTTSLQQQEELKARQGRARHPEKPDDILYIERKHLGVQLGEEGSKPRPKSQLVASTQQSRPSLSLRDAMLADPNELAAPSSDHTLRRHPPISRATRSNQRIAHSMSNTRAEKPGEKPTIERWSQTYSKWQEEWGKHPLTYHRTQVDMTDIPRLDEGEFLNDNILTFYLRYLQDEAEKEDPTIAKRVLILSTFFYEKLKPTGKSGINYEGVKTWTSKIDVASYDYILVPVNESYHWYLVLICNTPSLLPEPSANYAPADETTISAAPKKAATLLEQPVCKSHDEKVASATKSRTDNEGEYKDQELTGGIETAVEVMSIEEAKPTPSSPENTEEDRVVALIQSDINPLEELESPSPKASPTGQPPFKIIILDSLGSVRTGATTHLKEYLVREIQEKKGISVAKPAKPGMRARNIPQQSNFSDCGVYVLAYTKKFLSDPDNFANSIIASSNDKWDVNAVSFRGRIRTTIVSKKKEQKKLEDEQALQRSKLKKRPPKQVGKTRAKGSSASQGTPSSPTVPTQHSTPPKPNSIFHGLHETQEGTPGCRPDKNNVTNVEGATGHDANNKVDRGQEDEPSEPKLTHASPSRQTSLKNKAGMHEDVHSEAKPPQSSPAKDEPAKSSASYHRASPPMAPQLDVVDDTDGGSIGCSIMPSIEEDPKDESNNGDHLANSKADFMVRNTPEQKVDTTGLIKYMPTGRDSMLAARSLSPQVNSESGASLSNNPALSRGGSSDAPIEVDGEVYSGHATRITLQKFAAHSGGASRPLGETSARSQNRDLPNTSKATKRSEVADSQESDFDVQVNLVGSTLYGNGSDKGKHSDVVDLASDDADTTPRAHSRAAPMVRSEFFLHPSGTKDETESRGRDDVSRYDEPSGSSKAQQTSLSSRIQKVRKKTSGKLGGSVSFSDDDDDDVQVIGVKASPVTSQAKTPGQRSRGLSITSSPSKKKIGRTRILEGDVHTTEDSVVVE